MQNLVKTYFDQPGAIVRGNPYSVLNSAGTKPVSAASISYWTDQSKVGAEQFQKTQKAVQNIDNHLKEIQKLQQNYKGQEQGKSISAVAKKEQKKIAKSLKKTNKIIKKLNKKEQTLEKLINNPKIQDANVKNNLSTTLNQVKQYKTNLVDISSGLKKDLKQSHTAHISGPAASTMSVPSLHNVHQANASNKKAHRKHH